MATNPESRPESRTDTKSRALKEAGYTSPASAIFFCLLIAGLGGVLGSVYLAIAFNALFGMEMETWNSILGTAIGALGAGGLAYSKIWQGNLEAREQVEDTEWRRLSRELHSRMPGKGTE